MASIRKRGDSFTITGYLGYDANGRQIKKTTTYHPPEGVTAGKAEKLAKAFATQWEDKIRGFVALDENRTFAELSEWYYSSVAPLQLKPNVLIDNRTMINTYVMPTLARKKLKDINPAMLDALFADMRKNGRVKDTYRLKEGVQLPKGKGGPAQTGITQSSIARDTGVTRRSIVVLSTGGNVERRAAEKIAEHLGVRFDDMFESSVENRALAESSVSRVRRCLSAIFTAAVKKEIMRRNPVSNTVYIRKKSVKPVAYLNETQALELVNALEQKDFQFKVMISTLLFTGMRGGELCALQWEDLDLENGIIYIRHTLSYVRNEGAPRGQQKDSKGFVSTYELQSPKTEAGERYVVMPASLLALMKEYKAQQDATRPAEWDKKNMVFLSVKGNYYGEQLLNTQFKRLARKIGLPEDIHLHSLRHTTASLLINLDVSPKLIADQLGHASASITQDIYSHIFASSKARAAQALEIALGTKTE